MSISWASTNQHHYGIYLLKGTSQVGTISHIDPSTATSYNWTIPATIEGHTIVGTDYKIKVAVWNSAGISTGDQSDNYLTIKLSSAIDENINPAGSELYQNYPNPFNPVTRINYELRISNYAKLSVYNTKGEVVKTLVNGMQNAGKYSVNFDGAGLNSGVYFYKLETNGKSMVNKMLLVK